ncbi:hypothetical protein PPERSA_09573 [Pseudocohnilembus persalinus]|uniref:Uncharacterized protein n=1 Tax=Pseudocohnilembus persalinus TaxID=266149 RepID=A0A0V0QFK9_PSEPJ|nr:hypothetical protein PPERSA_09573 [Pseudocohnilembus persalinus]|eukprot:KRX00967.1 hypothetical protein PPERSA_09573 [Pseudocohnilembus persalinus]
MPVESYTNMGLKSKVKQCIVNLNPDKSGHSLKYTKHRCRAPPPKKIFFSPLEYSKVEFKISIFSTHLGKIYNVEYNNFKQQLHQNSNVQQDTCKSFIQLMKVYSQYNPAGLLGSAQRFIQCSASQQQSINGYDCCKNLKDGKFFIINWPNYVHEHQYEYLYVQNLKQGICVPNLCKEEDLNSNLDILNDIITNLQLDFFITSGNSDFQLPQATNNSTNSTLYQTKKTKLGTEIIFNS